MSYGALFLPSVNVQRIFLSVRFILFLNLGEDFERKSEIIDTRQFKQPAHACSIHGNSNRLTTSECIKQKGASNEQLRSLNIKVVERKKKQDIIHKSIQSAFKQLTKSFNVSARCKERHNIYRS